MFSEETVRRNTSQVHVASIFAIFTLHGVTTKEYIDLEILRYENPYLALE
jgi:hypothetical protein